MSPDEVARLVVWLADEDGAPAPLVGTAVEIFG
jgi:hypothetical protein